MGVVSKGEKDAVKEATPIRSGNFSFINPRKPTSTIHSRRVVRFVRGVCAVHRLPQSGRHY
jgi:hypothetical protein